MTDTPTTDQQPGTPPAQALNSDTAEHMIPKARFDEVNAKLRKLEADAAKRDADARALAEQEAAQRGEFEKLANERGTRLTQLEVDAQRATERAETLAAEMEKQIKTRLKALPEELQALMPDGDTLVRYTHLGKLEAAAVKLLPQRTPPPATDAAARGRSASTTDAVQAQTDVLRNSGKYGGF